MGEEERVRAAVRELAPPDAEHARRRAWQVSADAFAARPARAKRRRWRWHVASAAVVAAVAVVLTPAGGAVADLAREVVGEREVVVAPAPAPEATRPERLPARLPFGGAGPLRGWEGGAWSPRYRYVAAWRGRTLAAVAPQGRVAWRVAASAPVAGASWSPEGFHVAYLSGGQIRVVAGNGLRDRALRAEAAPVVPAFRPGERRTLAFVRRDGRIELRDVFTGARTVSQSRAGAGARELAWTRGGGTLAIRTTTAVRLWTPGRGTVTHRFAPARPRGLAGGTTIAVLTRDGRGTSEVVALRPQRSLLRVRARIADVAFTPDGRRVVAVWPGARQWLLLDAAR